MTALEKQELHWKIATLAESQGVAGTLVWQRIWECSAGHHMKNRSVADTCIYYDETERRLCGCDVALNRTPCDMTDATTLFAALQAWRDMDKDHRSWTIDVDSEDIATRVWDTAGASENWHAHRDDDPIEALAIAFALTLGGRNE